jgi:ribosomal-protein-alanine N-acetyltransferase
MELVTPRLRLRRARQDDLEALFGILSDPEAMRYWSTPPHADRSVTSAWLDRRLGELAAGADDWLITLDGEVIGEVGGSTPPEFGFIIARPRWRRGYALEAATAFLDKAFGVDGRELVTADVDPRNTGSLAVLDRLGFAETGRAEKTFEVADGWSDSIYFALSRADWLARQRPS